MAKKNGQTSAEDQATVETPPAGLDERHRALQVERREVEAELASIDGKIRNAIDNGDLESLDRFTARKAELPRLFIAASTAERQARQEIFNAEDAENLKRLRAAEDRRDKLKAALQKRKAEVEAELAKMSDELQEAEKSVSEVYLAINGSRELGAIGEAGFKKSLASLAGV